MFTIPTKLRAAIALGAAGAALAGGGVAAATIARAPASTGARVVVTTPTTIAQPIDHNKVGSAVFVGFPTDKPRPQV
jgi:hypothetical protein